jgi:hypothetical protein
VQVNSIEFAVHVRRSRLGSSSMVNLLAQHTAYVVCRSQTLQLPTTPREVLLTSHRLVILWKDNDW